MRILLLMGLFFLGLGAVSLIVRASGAESSLNSEEVQGIQEALF